MATTRVVASKSLNRLAAGGRQVRQLHLTEPANLPARTLGWDKSGLRHSQDIEGLKSECRKKGLSAEGNKFDLSARLGNPGARLFSTSDSSYGSPTAVDFSSYSLNQTTIRRASTSTAFSPTNQSRHFNSSSNLNAAGDESTIDFAILPDFPAPSMDIEFEDIRVPLLPQNSRPDGAKAPMASEIEDIASPSFEINVVSAESTHLAGGPSMMTEESDASNQLDLQGVARQVALGIEREGGEEVRKAKGLVKQVWTGFVDDLFGQKSSKS